eukprot:CAMPEP_0194286756 /NCGR_PEP_ID=MMETSP0169-20130528/33240_1 /TAXON_ID=218684 /ORGANISM="Corethron pennatum, Strain L29A3" /LENGTH=56 /DNA_ID=CAMNT_0039033269 /DNA_START=81 /DNA_END=247 /DNA_ORIENTATION=+
MPEGRHEVALLHKFRLPSHVHDGCRRRHGLTDSPVAGFAQHSVAQFRQLRHRTQGS